MSDKNNLYKITGTIFGKPVRTAPDKKGKNNGVPYEFPSLILEVKREYKGNEYIELPEFALGRGLGLTDFEVGDNVEITFSLSGRKISDTFHKTEPKAIYIRHSDIQTDDTRVVGGETLAEKRRREKAEKDVFVGVSPLDEDNESDLPF